MRSDKLDRELCKSFSDSEYYSLNDLYDAVLEMRDPNEMHKFFVDLCSRNELISMMHRWQIVRLLDKGMSYEEIIQEIRDVSDNPKSDKAMDDSDGTFSGGRNRERGKTRTGSTVSSTTISRVNNCYVNQEGGYATALARIKNKERGER